MKIGDKVELKKQEWHERVKINTRYRVIDESKDKEYIQIERWDGFRIWSRKKNYKVVG